MDNTARSTASLLLAGGGLVLFNGFRMLYEQRYVGYTGPIVLILGGAFVFLLGIMTATEKSASNHSRAAARHHF